MVVTRGYFPFRATYIKLNNSITENATSNFNFKITHYKSSHQCPELVTLSIFMYNYNAVILCNFVRVLHMGFPKELVPDRASLLTHLPESKRIRFLTHLYYTNTSTANLILHFRILHNFFVWCIVNIVPGWFPILIADTATCNCVVRLSMIFNK